MEHKKFAFISDFDGTLTHKDFYQMIIDEYLGEEGKDYTKHGVRVNIKIRIFYIRFIVQLIEMKMKY